MPTHVTRSTPNDQPRLLPLGHPARDGEPLVLVGAEAATAAAYGDVREIAIRGSAVLVPMQASE